MEDLHVAHRDNLGFDGQGKSNYPLEPDVTRTKLFASS